MRVASRRKAQMNIPEAPYQDSEWMLQQADVDSILPPVPMPKMDAPIYDGDITKTTNEQLMTEYCREAWLMAHGQDRVGMVQSRIVCVRGQKKLVEARLRLQMKGLPKAKVDLEIAGDEEYLNLSMQEERETAYAKALECRISAYSSRIRAMSRELTRRNIDAELHKAGI